MYFWDTYALVALLEGRPEYEPFRGEPVLCERDNLYELAYYLLRDFAPERAAASVEALRPELLEVGPGLVWRAAALRLAERRRKLSYVDALGYVLAREHGLSFLTGDKAFQDMEGVEYVAVTGARRG